MGKNYDAKNLIRNEYFLYDESLSKEDLENNYIKLEENLLSLFSKYITKIEQE